MERVMNSRVLVKQVSHLVLSCLIIGGASRLTFAQPSDDPQHLQTSGVSKIDHWLDYVRRTGDAKTTLPELVAAQSELKISYDLFLKRQDFAGASWSAIKIGDVERLQDKWDRAIPIYLDAIQLAKWANRADYQTKALARLAWAELKMGEKDAAQGHIREAVRLGADCGNKAFHFEALDVAGEIEVERGNLVAAAEYLDRALAMSRQIDDKHDLYLGYGDRGDIYHELAMKCDYQRNFDVCYQSLELARADYQKAIRLTQELGYDYISQLYRTLLNGLDAQKALLQYRQGGDRTVTDANLFSPQKAKDVLVTEHFTPGDLDPNSLAFVEGATKDLQAWMARLEKQGLMVPDLDPKDLFAQGLMGESRGNNDAALAAYRQAVDLLEKDRRKLRDEQTRGIFLEDKTDYYNYPALLLLDRKHYAEAFTLFERSRSRAMADMLASRELTLRTAPERELFSQLETLKINIAAQQEKLFNLTGSPDRDQHTRQIVELEAQIAPLQQQYQQLETRIAKEAPKLKNLTVSEPVALTSVQRSAAEGSYDLLYYVVLETAVILWHINGTGVDVKNVFLPHVQLIEKTAALRDSLVARRDAPDAAFDDQTSRQLFLYLIQPVLSSIQSHHLIIVPQEELNSIPFQALRNPETSEYLGERFEISYAPSATVLATLEKKSNLKSGRLLAVADPGIHDAREEVEAIGKLYRGRCKVVDQETAKKEDVKAWVSDYNLVHLSVHGKFNASDPLLSYLEFRATPSDNGHLTAAEMFGWPFEKNSVVVLSACETGRTEATHANEVLGMVRSLLYAGAGNLVLSSWEVSAGSTKVWMETFYREAQTKPPTEAARLALMAVKSRPEYSHPFFWAAFVMTGK
jgi:CHAT domain-containing protein